MDEMRNTTGGNAMRLYKYINGINPEPSIHLLYLLSGTLAINMVISVQMLLSQDKSGLAKIVRPAVRVPTLAQYVSERNFGGHTHYCGWPDNLWCYFTESVIVSELLGEIVAEKRWRND